MFNLASPSAGARQPYADNLRLSAYHRGHACFSNPADNVRFPTSASVFEIIQALRPAVDGRTIPPLHKQHLHSITSPARASSFAEIPMAIGLAVRFRSHAECRALLDI